MAVLPREARSLPGSMGVMLPLTRTRARFAPGSVDVSRVPRGCLQKSGVVVSSGFVESRGVFEVGLSGDV